MENDCDTLKQRGEWPLNVYLKGYRNMDSECDTLEI